jgi:Peptidyl-prolyl cis-trans isomerase (rotamase) - cyclophilin family
MKKFIFFIIFFIVTCMNQTKIEKKGTFAVIETDKGNLVIELFPNVAPKTVENFIKLSKEGSITGWFFIA